MRPESAGQGRVRAVTPGSRTHQTLAAAEAEEIGGDVTANAMPRNASADAIRKRIEGRPQALSAVMRANATQPRADVMAAIECINRQLG